MNSFMSSGDGFGLAGDIDQSHKFQANHPQPPGMGNITGIYNYVVNPRGDNLFLHISPNEGHQVIAALIFYSMWMGALGWDIVSTLHVDFRIAKETTWKSFPSACHSMAYFFSRYVNLTWLIQTVVYATTKTDDCSIKMRASVITYSIGLCSTTLVFALRTINIWHLRRRVAVPILSSWLLVVGSCVAVSWKGAYAHSMRSGAGFCTWKLGLNYSIAVICAVFIFDIVAFWLTALKLNRDGWAGLLKSLWPSTKRNIDAEDVSVMLMQRSTVFFVLQFCLLWIALGVFLGRNSIWYRMMMPVAIQSIGSSMAGRIFRRAWRLTRDKSSANKPPSYYPGWAEDQMIGRAGGGLTFNGRSGDIDRGTRRRDNTIHQEDVTIRGIASATSAGSAVGGSVALGISKWCMPIKPLKLIDDERSIETYIEGEFKRPSTATSDRSLPFSDPEQRSAAALYALQHRSIGQRGLRHSRSAHEGLRSRHRSSTGSRRLGRAFRGSSAASASELDLSQERTASSRGPIPPEMFEISANTLLPPGADRFSSFSNGHVPSGAVSLGQSPRSGAGGGSTRSSHLAKVLPLKDLTIKKPDAALTVSAGMDSHSHNLSVPTSERQRGKSSSPEAAQQDSSSLHPPVSPSRTTTSLSNSAFTSSTFESTTTRQSRRNSNRSHILVGAQEAGRNLLDRSHWRYAQEEGSRAPKFGQSSSSVTGTHPTSSTTFRPGSSGRSTLASPQTADAQVIDSRRSFIASPPMVTSGIGKAWGPSERSAYDLELLKAAAASEKASPDPQSRMNDRWKRASTGPPSAVRPNSSSGTHSLSFANSPLYGSGGTGWPPSSRPSSAPSRDPELTTNAAASGSEDDDVLHAFRALVAADADARTERSSLFLSPAADKTKFVESTSEHDGGRPRTSRGGGQIGRANRHSRQTFHQEDLSNARPSTATGEGPIQPFGSSETFNSRGKFRSSFQQAPPISPDAQRSPTSSVFAFAPESPLALSYPTEDLNPTLAISSGPPQVASTSQIPDSSQQPPPSFVEAVEAGTAGSDVDSSGQHCSAIERQYKKLEKDAALSDIDLGSDSTHSHSISNSHSFTGPQQ